MGGWMYYERLLRRHGLHRDYEYDEQGAVRRMMRLDLRRMEKDYLNPEYPEPPMARRPDRSDPAQRCADATGVPVETVRAVLSYVFLGGTDGEAGNDGPGAAQQPGPGEG